MTTTTRQRSPALRCPACGSPELRHEVGERYGCLNCGSRCIVDDQGRTKDFMPWKTAGARSKRRGARSR